MDRNWVVTATVALPEGHEEYLVAYGPAPRIYEALGHAKEAIAKKYPKEGGEGVEITGAKAGEYTEDGEWQVRLCFTAT